MNCQSFENIVNDLARDQIMEATVREQAALHSAGCETCAARLFEEHNLTKDLRELSARMQTDPTPNGVEARLVAEFRSYRRAKGVTGANVYHQPAIAGAEGYRQRYWAYAAVAAAVIVVVLGLTAIRFGRAGFGVGSVKPGPVVKKEDSVPQVNPTSHDFQANQENPDESLPPRMINPRRVVKRSAFPRARVAKNTVTVVSLKILPPNYGEVTTDFIPIAYSIASNVEEGGQVMRLELPRYAMARFGVPVNVDRYDERVKADVWVGADGLARAIRFVQ